MILYFQFVFVFAFVALVSCAPQSPQSAVRASGAKDDSQHAIILRYENDNIGVDGYNYM